MRCDVQLFGKGHYPFAVLAKTNESLTIPRRRAAERCQTTIQESHCMPFGQDKHHQGKENIAL